jgi:hypothetical protein
LSVPLAALTIAGVERLLSEAGDQMADLSDAA